MRSFRFQLNETKLEMLSVFSSLRRSKPANLQLFVGDTTISSTLLVRDLGVLIDSQLDMTRQINAISSREFYRMYLNRSSMTQLVHALVISQLDHANALYVELPYS